MAGEHKKYASKSHAHVSAKDYSRKHVTMEELLLYEALGDEEYRKAAKSGRLQAMLDRIATELPQNCHSEKVRKQDTE